MNRDANIMILVIAGVATLVYLVFLILFFSYARLWIQALLTGTRVGIGQIISMRMMGYPPKVIVGAMIALKLRGVRVSSLEMLSCYIAAFKRGERIETANELADLMEAIKRNESNQR